MNVIVKEEEDGIEVDKVKGEGDRNNRLPTRCFLAVIKGGGRGLRVEEDEELGCEWVNRSRVV